MSRVERHADLYKEDLKLEEQELENANKVEQSSIEAPAITSATEAEVKPAGGKNIKNKFAAKIASKGKTIKSPSLSGNNKNELTWQGKLLLSVGTAILALTLILCLFLMLPKFLGIKNYLVASGSMEPTIPIGSMIYSKEVNPVNLKEGDIVVFLKAEEDNVPITHRVLDNDEDAKTLITKGDHNVNSDPMPVLYNNVIGKVIWHTPALGVLTLPLTKLSGKLVMLFAASIRASRCSACCR